MRARMRLLGPALTLSILVSGNLLFGASASAQQAELTSADRLAMLYTSQMAFDAGGTPIVKVGIADGQARIAFAPDGPVRVLPTGHGGPILELPGGRTYTISISDGKAGTYRHAVVLERFHHGESDALTQAQEAWTALGVHSERIEVGSLFAISGSMFDSREQLLVTTSTSDLDGARKLEEQLERRHDKDLSIHSELDTYPTATLSLEGAGEGIRLEHKDVLWIDVGDAGARVIDVPTEANKKEDRIYAGTLVFTPDREGTLAMVNMVPVETVLRGVVPSEIFHTAPSEALKVQAIAARGTLVSQIGARHLADPYNLCDEQHCQVFGGMGKAKERTDKAIAETRGELLFAGKRIAETYYSSNCGGMSEAAEAVWEMSPRAYLHAHTDTDGARDRTEAPSEAELTASLSREPEAFCNSSEFSSGKHFRWTRTFTPQEMDDLVAKKHDQVGHVIDLIIRQRGPGGRVMALEIIGSAGRHTVERELPVRRLFGGLKSGLFVLEITRDADSRPVAFTFRGGGFGHGVGMCQTGAMGMASKGHDYEAILQHYYGGAHLRRLW